MSPLVAYLVQLGLSLLANAPAELATFVAMVGQVRSLLAAKDQATVDNLLAVIQPRLDADLAKGIADAQAAAGAG